MWLAYLSLTVLMLVGILLIFIVLLQRGRGGGLAGALGGMGGQSAFGTKAGDVFTRITIGLAIIWVLLAAGSTFALRSTTTIYSGGAAATTEEPAIIPAEPNAKTNPTTTSPHGGGVGDLGLPPLPEGKRGTEPGTTIEPPAAEKTPAAEKDTGTETPPAAQPPAADKTPSPPQADKAPENKSE